MKGIAGFSVLLLIAVQASALEVDRNEIRTDSSIRIEFQNYEGPPAKVETLDQIRGIGSALGKEGAASVGGRYRVVRAIDPAVKNGLDADIFILEKDASVDHIKNLRIILSGYLSAAYGYSDRDSLVLAEFITVYNAVNRKNLDYFKGRFKPIVIANLSADRAGLALSYKEWPGGTEIVVPLSDPKKGSLSAVDTGQISEKKVVEDLKTREDKGIELRKDLIDIKERQIVQEESKVREEKKAIAEEKKAVEARETAVKEEKKSLEAEKRSVEEAAKSAEKAKRETTAPAETSAAGKTETAAKKEEIAKKEEVLTKETTAIEEKKQELEKRREETAKKEETIERKKEEVRTERKEIAKDQQEVLNKEGSASVGIPFVKAERGGGGRLVLVNPKTGEVLLTSPEAPLAVRGIEPFGNGLAAVLSRGAGGKLSILDAKTLREKMSAREDVGRETLFRVNGNELFAVIKDGSSWYLGKYDTALSLLARSRVEVDPATFLVFAESAVFVQAADGRVLPLKLATMDATN